MVVTAPRIRRDSLGRFAVPKGQPLIQQQSPGLVRMVVEQRSPSSEICQFGVEMEWGGRKAEETRDAVGARVYSKSEEAGTRAWLVRPRGHLHALCALSAPLWL